MCILLVCTSYRSAGRNGRQAWYVFLRVLQAGMADKPGVCFACVYFLEVYRQERQQSLVCIS